MSPVASATVTVNTVVSSCGMQMGGPPAFCETFDAPAGTGNRSGQLNGDLWGVSRITGDTNYNPSQYVAWVKSQLTYCGGSLQPAQPDSTDNIICNGQYRESSNDNSSGVFEGGTVIALTAYPKQPFNFAGRTGTISFDVSNDVYNSHDVWPELWITDKPIPAPFTHFNNVGGNIPANGVGIRFDAAGTNGGTNCPAGPRSWSVGGVIAVRNYVIDDTEGYGTRTNMTLNVLGCVLTASGPDGPLNHVEVQISQNQIDIYATDPGSTNLVHIAQVTNANLSLSQGLIWLEDAHYNADKSGVSPSHANHTFTWDNVAFDGPVVARDLSYDVLDPLTPCHNGTLCLGWSSNPSVPTPVLSTLPMTAAGISASTAQFLMFNAWFLAQQPTSFTYSINGHTHTVAWPFPFSLPGGSVSAIVPVAASDLVAGPNNIQILVDPGAIVSNINIVLAGAGGVVPPVAPRRK
jgi:hypothetical protein